MTGENETDRDRDRQNNKGNERKELRRIQIRYWLSIEWLFPWCRQIDGAHHAAGHRAAEATFSIVVLLIHEIILSSRVCVSLVDA